MTFKKNLVQIFIILTNKYTNAVIIKNMYIPELVQSGSSDVTLVCWFSEIMNNYSVYWLFNGKKIKNDNTIHPSGKFTEMQEIQGSFNPQIRTLPTQSALSFRSVTPSMSGNYTCQLVGDGLLAKQTKPMLVFSPEKDFTLEIKYPNIKHRTVHVKCIACGLYPKPEINLQLDKPVSKQVQRVWWKGDSYIAEGSAELYDVEGNQEVTCRLHLPQADYTAIMKKVVRVGKIMCCNSDSAALSNIMMFVTICLWLAFL